MPANIAPTSFGTTPDDKAVVVDIYGGPPKSPTNNIPGLPNIGALNQISGLNGMAAGLLKNITSGYIKTGKFSLDGVNDAITSMSNNLKMNKGILKSLGGTTIDILLKGSGFYNTGIGKVVDGIAKVATKSPLESGVLSQYRDLTMLVGGVEKVIKNVKDVDSLTDLSKLIGSISGDNEYLKLFNLTEVAGVIKGVNDIAASFEIPGVFDKLISQMSDSDKKRVSALVISGTTTLGSISTIDTMMEHMSGSELLSANPYVIKMMVNEYKGEGQFSTPSKEAADYLLERLNKITPNWYQVYTGKGWVDDLSVFAEFNVFTRDSFLIGDYFKSQLAICGNYTPKSFQTLAREFYPYIGLPESKNTLA